MSKARLYSSILLVFAVAACGGDDGGVSGDGATFITLKRKSTLVAIPAPAPAPAPAPVTASTGSLLPYIDNAKIPAAAVGYSTARIKVETFDVPKQNTDGTGQFRFTCDFSHMSYDDPIVFPGKQGATHLHTFFGNTGINYASTQASIETSGNSTCAGGTANRTGYWVPAVIDTKDGTPIKPSKIMVYYKSDFLPGVDTKPYPAGLRMIAGDMKSSAGQDRTDWGCMGPNGENEQRFKSIPTSCPVGYTVEATIEFPTCWDGINLDSPDHKSHMSFTVWNNDTRKVVCPASHPVQVPTLTEKIQYTVAEAGSTARWRLSSDNYSKDLPGGFSIHADWFNGWDPKVQAIWLKSCLQAARDCHGFLLGDGTKLY
jgi:hypothetical protein